MRPRRLVTILANSAAILLLGLVGVAFAGPSLVLPGGLDIYGPTFFNGVFTLISGPFSGARPFLFSADGTYYATPDISNLLNLLSKDASNFGNIQQLIILPVNDSLFANVPEPLGLAVVVSGIAALTFLRRRFRRSRPD